MLMGVQPQPDMAGQNLILFLTELRVDLLERAPHGRVVFLAISGPTALCVIKAQAHDVAPRAGKNGQQTLVCPLNLEWVLQCGSQVG